MNTTESATSRRVKENKTRFASITISTSLSANNGSIIKPEPAVSTVLRSVRHQLSNKYSLAG
jgi:hypothetical protein